jgi:trehalose synthase
VVWRCHVGADASNDRTETGWSFLEPHLRAAQAYVFSRREYAPPWLPADRVAVIPPSLDPFSAKNAPMDPSDVDAALGEAGLVDTDRDGGSLAFTRRDGSVGTVRPHDGLVLDGAALPRDTRVVLQVSRWDRLKDMGGVLQAFAEHVRDLPPDVHLLLAGPEVSGVSDDPEGAEVLGECQRTWEGLPEVARRRAHLACLPMDDTDENAHLVNALQRRAAVVVQKSLVEGFGLTVTEPMWKGRPVVASRVGGIQDQVVDGESGLLLEDPRDLGAFMGLVERVLADEDLAAALGAGAREAVCERFLGDRHLEQYVRLVESLS